jgi:hypothetical protein
MQRNFGGLTVQGTLRGLVFKRSSGGRQVGWSGPDLQSQTQEGHKADTAQRGEDNRKKDDTFFEKEWRHFSPQSE